MPQTQTVAPVELILNRTFRAPIDKVFRAWTNPSEIDRWFGPSDDVTVSSSIDFRVGGSYQIDIHKPDGTVFSVAGKYLEIQPPHLLSFTWKGACDFEPSETLVSLEFFSLGDSTQVTLTHQNFSSDDSRQRHDHGWTGSLARLEKVL
jgi:uncharacterized protein YndB with AHSA1/START domain